MVNDVDSRLIDIFVRPDVSLTASCCSEPHQKDGLVYCRGDQKAGDHGPPLMTVQRRRLGTVQVL